MLKIAHRINTIEELINTDSCLWVEIDLRMWISSRKEYEIILHHDVFENGKPVVADSFAEWLEHYKHKLIILNIKESWIEDKVLEMVETAWVEKYFLLDVEFPYIYSSTRKGNRNIAIRYSEDEPIEQALLYKDKADYLFIDVQTKLPIDSEVIEQMKGFKTCLVSPDRWGREEDIIEYKKQMEDLWFDLDMVMVWKKSMHLWG